MSVRHPENLKRGDRVYGGTAVKGVVVANWKSRDDVALAWDCTTGMDSLSKKSPLWLFLTKESK